MRLMVSVVEAASRFFAVVSAAMIGILVLMIIADIASRSVFGGSIPGGIEAAVLLLVAIIYLGLAGTEVSNANFRVELVQRLIPPKAMAAVNRITTAISFVTVSTVAYATWPRAINATTQGESTYGIIAFPVWPSRIVVSAGLTLLAMQLLVNLLSRKGGRAHDSTGAPSLE